MTADQLGYLFGYFLSPLLYMLIIGTIYYWSQRGSITFRQAILNRRVITLSLILFLLGLYGRTSTYLQQESSHVYPEEAVRKFTTACVDTAKAKLDIKVAEKYCSCTISEIQKSYTYGEFKKLGSEMEKNKTVPSGVRDVLNSCVQRLSQ
jgi:hypothetical protein